VVPKHPTKHGISSSAGGGSGGLAATGGSRTVPLVALVVLGSALVGEAVRRRLRRS
jgi:hypothetical protein